jgi:mono/diheme cytochrome c family protein
MQQFADLSRLIRVGAERSLWLTGLRAAAFALQVSFAATDAANAQVVRIADNPVKVAITEDARDKARDIFTQRCATCHGADGHGNGPAAANLKPRPIDFHSQNWQKSVTDDTMTKAIIFGGHSVGKSGQMAPNPDLENEPAIVAALVEKIRKWGR